MSIALEVKNVGIQYRRKKGFFSSETFTAIQDLSFTVNKGESIAIIGKNGAGKSTLLRAMGGIVKPDFGQIINHNCKTSLLALQAGFDLELSGHANAILSGILLGFRKQEVLEKMPAILAYSELGEFINQPVKSYSSGMRARLGFSVAIQLETDVLLIDEVLGVGDIDFQRKSQQTIEKILRSNQTVVLVTHSIAKAKALCSRAIWINEGTMQASGPIDEVLHTYSQFMNSNGS